MAKKTVSDVLKELPGIDRKDFVAYLEKQKGKISTKTTLAEDELERAKEHFGQGRRRQVTIGEQRVSTRNTPDESGATTQETLPDLRWSGTTIRRRKAPKADA